MFIQRLLVRVYPRANHGVSNWNSSTSVQQEQQLSTSSYCQTPEAKDTPTLPPRPKKPITPWFMYFRDKKDDVLRGQKMSAAELAATLAKEWKYFDKSNYQAEYNRLHREYLSAKTNYEMSLTPEQKQHLEETEKDRSDQRARRELRRTKPPKLPRNPANFYFSEKSSEPGLREKLGVQSQGELLSMVFKEYASLSGSEKEKYLRMQEKDKERFRSEFMSWYEGIMSDKSVSKLARTKAEAMRTRFKLLSYI